VNRPQPVVAVHRDLLLDEYRDVVADLGGQRVELGYTHLTLNPLHPDVRSAGEPKQAGETR